MSENEGGPKRLAHIAVKQMLVRPKGGATGEDEKGCQPVALADEKERAIPSVVGQPLVPPPPDGPPVLYPTEPSRWQPAASGDRVRSMTIRKIATIGHPVLRQKARPVTRAELESPEMQGFIDDLIETMRDANGAGLAANQVYEPVQICVIEVGDNPRYPYKPKIPLTVLVNPEIELLGDETFDNFEGCLSVPDLRGVVPRHVRIRVRAWDRHGQPIDQVVEGLSAGTYQHECDHLQGRLFLDGVRDTTTLCTWKEFERHHRDAFVARVQKLVERFGS